MYLVVGLGNPEEEYLKTRHNIGFMVAEEIATRLDIGQLKSKSKCRALVGEGSHEGHKVIVALPQTFMNLSGEAVHALVNWYKIPADHLIVLHDDVDIEPGEIRVRFGGGAGGHHGIESIIAHIKTPDFVRIRVGVGREAGFQDVSQYVLENIPPSQKSLIDEAMNNAASAAVEVISGGLKAAMNKFNGANAS